MPQSYPSTLSGPHRFWTDGKHAVDDPMRLSETSWALRLNIQTKEAEDLE